MNLENMKFYTQQGIKLTHTYFTDNEYLIMRGNMVVFEDGAQMFLAEWARDKDYLNEGWSFFPQKDVPDGYYMGRKEGHIFELEIEKDKYQFGLKEGVRGINIRAGYNIRNGILIEK